MFGLVEVITLLLGLAGFGLAPNPKPATSEQALQYAIPDADVVVHVDIASIVSTNYKTLVALPNQPQIKSSPELSKVVREVVMKVEGARNITKLATGIDVTTDFTDATACFQVVPNSDPAFVVTVHGKQLAPALVDKFAQLAGAQAVAIGGGKLLEVANEPSLAITKDGVMLAGTPKLVRDRLAPTWKPPPRGPGTNLAFAAAAIDAKPVLAWVVTLSQTARKELVGKVGGKSFLTDVLGRHRAYAGSVFHDGIGWTWIDTTKPGLDQIATVSEGVVELLRAAHIAPRAIAKILLGAIESHRGTNRQVDAIIQRKGELMKIVESYTGDGTFKVAVTKDAARLRLDVRATGKTLSEVVPAGLIGPAAALTLFAVRSGGPAPTPPPAIPAPAPPAKKK